MPTCKTCTDLRMQNQRGRASVRPLAFKYQILYLGPQLDLLDPQLYSPLNKGDEYGES